MQHRHPQLPCRRSHAAPTCLVRLEACSSPAARTRPCASQLRPEAVTRQLGTDGPHLVLDFAAVDMRTLRAAVGTFCDLLGLATRTLEAFGPPETVAAAQATAAAADEQQQQQQQQAGGQAT